MERGRLLDAQRAAESLVVRHPRDPNVHQLLGMVAGRRHRFDVAIEHFERLSELVPADPMAPCRIGMSCMYAGRFDEADAAFDRALALRPGFPDAIRGRAELQERRGDPAAGLATLAALLEDPAIAAQPATRILHAQLLSATGDHAAAAEVAGEGARTPGVGPAFLRKLWFVRGRALDRVGTDPAAAVEAWTRANAIGARPFDPDAYDREVDAIVATFTAERLARTAAGPDAPGCRSRAVSDRPILVVGLPRSGSTLVEQILDAHPEAAGAGESRAMLDAMGQLARAHAGSEPRGFPHWWPDVDEPALTRAAANYLDALADDVPAGGGRAGSTRRLVDKNLQNLPLAGAIAEMLPGARFVICRRDAVDNGFSCWINDLSPIGFPWTSDLGHVGRVSVAWARLAEHWARAMPARVHVVPYEAMVTEPEARTRALLQFAGLPWDPAVLRFHERDRAVSTLSYDQVRQPIYRSSVRRSDRYRPFLGPLVDAVRAGGLDSEPPADG